MTDYTIAIWCQSCSTRKFQPKRRCDLKRMEQCIACSVEMESQLGSLPCSVPAVHPTLNGNGTTWGCTLAARTSSGYHLGNGSLSAGFFTTKNQKPIWLCWMLRRTRLNQFGLSRAEGTQVIRGWHGT